jgi:F-type H+-transporting ATPase subunit b
MDLVTPHIGLVFWTTLCFGILLFILGKYAWKPILAAVKEREDSIESALLKAEALKEEMARMTSENEDLLKQARAEETANTEGARMIEKARVEINNQKAIAMADVKNQVASLSLEIAEKVLRKQFEDVKKQDDLVTELLKEVKL